MTGSSSCIVRGGAYLFFVVVLIARNKVNDIADLVRLVGLTRCNLEARRLRNPLCVL